MGHSWALMSHTSSPGVPPTSLLLPQTVLLCSSMTSRSPSLLGKELDAEPVYSLPVLLEQRDTDWVVYDRSVPSQLWRPEV